MLFNNYTRGDKKQEGMLSCLLYFLTVKLKTLYYCHLNSMIYIISKVNSDCQVHQDRSCVPRDSGKQDHNEQTFVTRLSYLNQI